MRTNTNKMDKAEIIMETIQLLWAYSEPMNTKTNVITIEMDCAIVTNMDLLPSAIIYKIYFTNIHLNISIGLHCIR